MLTKVGMKMNKPIFEKGDLVRSKSTGETFTINKISPGLKEIYYLVLDSKTNSVKRMKESDLLPFTDNNTAISQKVLNMEFSNADSFQRFAYHKLFSEKQQNNIFSYQGNRIIFNPFQYKPLLKFISTESDERILIADEVGVGKTIESGIILDELFARGELKEKDSIFIVCPSVLCHKWQAELRDKFLLDDFYIHDGKTLTYLLDYLKRTGRNNSPHSIVSEQLFRSEKNQLLLKEILEEKGEPFIKMVIMDECHHYRNTGTLTNSFGNLISLCTEKMIMLSATPFNLRSSDLYNQLHILNPSQYPSKEEFSQLIFQIQCVNKSIAILQQQTSDNDRELLLLLSRLSSVVELNPYVLDSFNKYFGKIRSGKVLTLQERVEFIEILKKLNPIASSFTRTLKREALQHRVTRETLTLGVDLSPLEKSIYREYLQINLRRYTLLGISERAHALLLNGLERIAASSIAALRKNILHFIDMSDEEIIELFDGEEL